VSTRAKQDAASEEGCVSAAVLVLQGPSTDHGTGSGWKMIACESYDLIMLCYV